MQSKWIGERRYSSMHLYLFTGWRWMASFAFQQLYSPSGRRMSVPQIQSERRGQVSCLCQESNHYYLVVQPVVLLLYWLNYPSSLNLPNIVLRGLPWNNYDAVYYLTVSVVCSFAFCRHVERSRLYISNFFFSMGSFPFYSSFLN